MTTMHDPELDLILERTVDTPRQFVWDAWTRPALLRQWFCPKPWRTTDAELDVRPGGVFRTTMAGPDGQEVVNTGCFLEVVPLERLVWTGALGADYRPQILAPDVPFVMTAIIELATTPSGGTHYKATVLHADPSGRARHEAMGFHFGWSAALDQLVALATR